MEHNDQVQDEPFIGGSGEVKKDTSKEENSAHTSSEKKEETKTQDIPAEKTEEVVEGNANLSSQEEEQSNEKQVEPGTKESPESVAPETEQESPAPEPAEEKPVTEPEEKPVAEPEEKPVAEPEEKPVAEPEEKPVAEPESSTEKDTPGAKVKETGDSKSEGKTDQLKGGSEPAETEPAEQESSETEPAETEPAETEPSETEPSETEPVAETEDPAKDEAAENEETSIPDFDYSTLSREDLVNRLEVLLENQNVQEIRSDVDHIKVNFYKKNKIGIEAKRKAFIEDGGNLDDFQVKPDGLEEKVKNLLKDYRDQKTEFNKNIELEKTENLKRKYDVIEKLKELVNGKESINKTFNEFRDLQREWRMIGLVPQQNLKDLWDTYNHHVEKFYDYIKINKELRDLDLKKNLELKMQLCERAEELLLESSVVNAFKSLQKYHDRWREIGPVPVEVRSEIWERFREATSKINKRHQEYFEGLKKEQKHNLEQKTLLCEQAEEISNQVLETHKQWDEKSRELIEIQKVWKSIGFAPKKDNTKIYERFRKACDTFFNRKREFYSRSKELQMNNLQLKTDLCVQAEALQESTEWKKTTDDLINLQKKWKEIGPVPKKHSDAVWKRFRAACDHFFQKKSAFYKNIDQSYSQNLEEKKKLLKEIEELKLGDNVEESFKLLNECQRKWADIGFVPIKEKEKLQEQFRIAINKHFDSLDITDNRKNMLKFRNKLDNMQQKPKAGHKINQERERYMNRLQQLKNDIVLWENNIGFFAKSKNAESMINEVQAKIDKAKETIKLLEQKIDMIDTMN